MSAMLALLLSSDQCGWQPFMITIIHYFSFWSLHPSLARFSVYSRTLAMLRKVTTFYGHRAMSCETHRTPTLSLETDFVPIQLCIMHSYIPYTFAHKKDLVGHQSQASSKTSFDLKQSTLAKPACPNTSANPSHPTLPQKIPSLPVLFMTPKKNQKESSPGQA